MTLSAVSVCSNTWSDRNHEESTDVKSQPLVSAVIPTYNRANVVCEAVESVLQQTYLNVEVIVIDDGSTDDTQRQLKRYGNRIRVATQANAGPSAARNHGIALAQGDFIAFLDSDDLWLPTKLERQVALLQRGQESVPCCLCNIAMQWHDGELGSFETAWLYPSVEEGLWLNVDEMVATRFVLFNQGIVIRREVLKRIGGFNEGLRLLEDTDLALRLSLEGPWAFVREPLVVWRESQESLYQESRVESIRSKKPMVQILETHLARVEAVYQRKNLWKRVNRELNRARRELRAASLSQMSSWKEARVGRFLQKMEQYRRSVFLRTPSFPKMKVVSFDDWESQNIRHIPVDLQAEV